jgi:hypothetical protein
MNVYGDAFEVNFLKKKRKAFTQKRKDAKDRKEKTLRSLPRSAS